MNKACARRGLKRMFLHAAQLTIAHPTTGTLVTFDAPLPADLASFVQRLETSDAAAI